MQSIERVAVVGAGYMGGGIAQSLVLAGMDVRLADVSAEAAHRALERLLAESVRFEEEGLFPEGATETLRARLRAADSIEEAVADVDFVEEAVFEVPETKKEVLARIEKAKRPETIVGTNTSTIPVRVLAEAFEDPSRFLTVHFSNPAPFIPGVELVAGERTDEAVFPLVEDMLRRAGRRSARVADVPGFVLNRLQYVLLKEAMAVVEEGIATPEDVDTIVSTTFGYRLPFFGPFAIADQAGLDVYANGFAIMEKAFGERLAAPGILKDLVARGHYGVKTGSGFLSGLEGKTDEVVAHRNTAYGRLAGLLRELGPSPLRED